jgi:hypothetical protein
VPETHDLFPPVLGLQIGQVVGWLSCPIDRDQQAEVVSDCWLNRPYDLSMVQHRVTLAVRQVSAFHDH